MNIKKKLEEKSGVAFWTGKVWFRPINKDLLEAMMPLLKELEKAWLQREWDRAHPSPKSFIVGHSGLCDYLEELLK